MSNNVISLVPRNDKDADEYRKGLLDVIDNFRIMVVNGEIQEFVIASLSSDNTTILSACCRDFVGGIGLLELAKNTMINTDPVEFINK